MIVGILSDTHGNLRNTRDALGVLEPFRPEALIHCGDIGSPAVISLLEGWLTHYVFGNVDDDRAALKQAMEKAGHHCHGEFGTLELAGAKIAFLHGHDGRLLEETLRGGKHHLVCHGHTHAFRQEHMGGTLVLNPGAVHRASPHSVAVIDLPSLEVTRLVF